jgi:hypothetical protein
MAAKRKSVKRKARPTVIIRMPIEMQDWLRAQAMAKYTTITSQVLSAIAAQMKQNASGQT